MAALPSVKSKKQPPHSKIYGNNYVMGQRGARTIPSHINDSPTETWVLPTP